MAIQVKNIKGWKFKTLLEFNLQRASVDVYLGLPIAGMLTQTSMEAKENYDEFGGLLFYYIGFNTQIVPYMPDPIFFDVNLEIPDRYELQK